MRPPPANAAAISQVLNDISNPSCPPLLTRSDQQTYLEKLTSTHKFTYYSATYGHTAHDAASLRKVLANTMRHHPSPDFGTAGGNAAVDMLFEYGCEMLEPAYVDEVMRAAVHVVVEKREDEDEEDSEDDAEYELDDDAIEGKGGEQDADFVPPGRRRLRKREPPADRKRKISHSSSEEPSPSREGWEVSSPKKIKQRRGGRSEAVPSTSAPYGQGRREPKGLKGLQRSDVGGFNAMRRSQLGVESGRDITENAVDHVQGCRRASGLAGHSQSKQPGQSSGYEVHETQIGGGQSDNVRLREAVERLNRRVHTAIVQLWDEIGGIA